MHGGPDCAAPDWWLARAMMAGDEDNKTFPVGDRLFKRAVDRPPRTVEAHSVKVDGPVRDDRAAAKPFVPATIKCCSSRVSLLDGRPPRWPGSGLNTSDRRRRFISDFSCLLIVLFSG
jgi:hypothetical protein